ncbi:SCO1664 family protein [Streptomyces sp. H10-C2]|uniref:SCO1664 family protein n=1 Tax=unclassified Streptomyces TaxID=2593676 RepID=UPI0024BBAE24|nr:MULTISPECIES: SCO1664 family protein [unclassified Streptomyces]MDJ0344585.1 SCO1664 family protein [Streptomyces sp. PH10-H1]MDJ0371006.1 SCO1664 family protein [Streptomyces sp. H10-C2]
MPAPERVPARSLTGATGTDGGADRTGDTGAADGQDAAQVVQDAVELLTRGELTVRGQLRDASNAVLYCEVEYDGRKAECVYKPVAGERPLWDFPDGTLAEREVAAYLVSEATGWGLVPPTVLRDGPYGEGMVQLWIEAADEGVELLALVEEAEPGPGWKPVVRAEVGEGRTALLVHADDPRLSRLAVLDAVINNADRKGGHLLPAPDGRLYGIDHGIAFHTDDKLRTLLWGWADEPLPDEAVAALRRLAAALEGELGRRLGELLTSAEVAAVSTRVAELLRTGRYPRPSGQWPAIPWPPV